MSNDTIHMIAAKNYVASRKFDSDYRISYSDLGNDGVKIAIYYIINQYRDSDTFIKRVRNGEIYEVNHRGRKGRVVATYNLQTGEINHS